MDISEEHMADGRLRTIYRATIAGSVCNLLLLVFKLAAGVVGQSAAMVADAVHSLSDFVTDIIVLLFVRLSARPEDRDHHYGHGKYETLASALVGLFLLVAGAGILWHGAERIVASVKGEPVAEPGLVALLAAVVSIAVKELLFRYTIYIGRRTGSSAVEANAWHHRSDALSSVGTMLGIGGAILLGKNWRVLDAVAAVVVSLLIIKEAVRIVRISAGELLESSLSEAVEERILEVLLSFAEVSQPHHLRTRRIGTSIAIDVHIRMDGRLTLHQSHDITRRIEAALRQEFGQGTFITLHVEPAQ